jgi:predicted RNase H-like HicB family nuclease
LVSPFYNWLTPSFQTSFKTRQGDGSASPKGYAPQNAQINQAASWDHVKLENVMSHVTYLALIHPPEAGSAWGVTFPDLPGCVSAGDSFEAAVAAAGEALAGHVAAMLADGEDVPSPRPFDVLAKDDEVIEAREEDHAIPVPVPLIPVVAPKERINIMMDRGMLRLVDQAARAEGISRSLFLERAARMVVTPTPELPPHLPPRG